MEPGTVIDNWIINFYDRTVSESGTDGIKLADATSATVENVTRTCPPRASRP